MIVLEKCQLRRQRGRRNETLDYYAATGWRARRNGVLLRAVSGSHTRQWITEERARKALARDWPGETVVVAERMAAE